MGQPNIFVYLALAAFVPLVAVLFRVMPGPRSVLVSLAVGWMFLPWFNGFGDRIPLLHLKQMFVPAVVLATSLLLDRRSWNGFRVRAVDLPMVVFCVLPFLTSLANDMGIYDAGSALFEAATKWGAPYLLARVYLRTPGAAKEAARAIVGAALVYVPFALWEVRMSPQLHFRLYGFYQHSFLQHVRDGHYRPMLFMAHGLMVAMFMTSGTLVAAWLWRTGARRRILGVPMGVATIALAITTLLTRSAGPIVLLGVGLLVLEATHRSRRPVFLLVLALAPATYCVARGSGWWGATPILQTTARFFSPERTTSLRIRLTNEDRLVERALERPWLGWGRSDRFRVRDEEGNDITITDGFWVVILGTQGVLGLAAVGLFLALPQLLLLRSVPARFWGDPRMAPAAAMSVALGVWVVDELLNAMLSPLFLVMAGAVVSFALAVRDRRAMGRSRRRRPAGTPVAPVVSYVGGVDARP